MALETLVIGVIVIILGLLFVVIYNKLIKLRNRV